MSTVEVKSNSITLSLESMRHGNIGIELNCGGQPQRGVHTRASLMKPPFFTPSACC